MTSLKIKELSSLVYYKGGPLSRILISWQVERLQKASLTLEDLSCLRQDIDTESCFKLICPFIMLPYADRAVYGWIESPS